VDYKITKNLWTAMGVQSIKNASATNTASLPSDPVELLAKRIDTNSDDRNPNVVYVDYNASLPKMLAVKVACGLRDDMHNNDGSLKGSINDEEFADSLRIYVANFSKYFKDWLIGNNIPYVVQVFLEQINWQGFRTDKSMKDPDQRKAHFSALIQCVYDDIKQTNGTFHAGLGTFEPIQDDKWELVVIRPNIEHNMLGMVMGRGGLDELGATFWGQTELSCFDDSMHGNFLRVLQTSTSQGHFPFWECVSEMFALHSHVAEALSFLGRHLEGI
jgi:hypothetical protein